MEKEVTKLMHEKTHVCRHTDRKRKFTGTCVISRLKRQLPKGTELSRSMRCSILKKKSNQLFRGYIHTFLKLKQQVAGWPTSVGDDETRCEEYTQLYQEAEGIVLEYSEIMKNAGLYYLAKIMVNSFWGKFGRPLIKRKLKFYRSSRILCFYFGLHP